MILKERLERLVLVVEEASETELRVLTELLEEKVNARPVVRHKHRKIQKNVKVIKQKKTKYSKAQIVKAFELKKKGVSQGEIAKKTGIKKGSLRNPSWLSNKFKKISN